MADPDVKVEADAPPAPAAPPATHTVSAGEDGATLYPAALASHEAVCEDEALFTRLLQDLNAKLQAAEPRKYRPARYRVPTGEA